VVGAAEADIRYSECSGIEYREQEPAGGKRCAMRARHVVEELTLRSHQVDGIVAANHDLIPPEAYSTARPWLEATAVIEAGRQSPCLVANSVAALASSGIAASGICPLRSAPEGMFMRGLSCDREPSARATGSSLTWIASCSRSTGMIAYGIPARRHRDESFSLP
jgi:hypothetical protein